MSCPTGVTGEICNSLASSSIVQINQTLPKGYLGEIMADRSDLTPHKAKPLFGRVIETNEPLRRRDGTFAIDEKQSYRISVKRWGDNRFQVETLKKVGGLFTTDTEWEKVKPDDPHPEMVKLSKRLLAQYQGLYRAVDHQLVDEIDQGYIQTGELPPILREMASRLSAYESIGKYCLAQNDDMIRVVENYTAARLGVNLGHEDTDTQARFQQATAELLATLDRLIGIDPQYTGPCAEMVRATRDNIIQNISARRWPLLDFYTQLPISLKNVLMGQDAIENSPNALDRRILTTEQRRDYLEEVVADRNTELPLEYLLQRPRLLAERGL